MTRERERKRRREREENRAQDGLNFRISLSRYLRNISLMRFQFTSTDNAASSTTAQQFDFTLLSIKFSIKFTKPSSNFAFQFSAQTAGNSIPTIKRRNSIFRSFKFTAHDPVAARYF